MKIAGPGAAAPDQLLFLTFGALNYNKNEIRNNSVVFIILY